LSQCYSKKIINPSLAEYSDKLRPFLIFCPIDLFYMEIGNTCECANSVVPDQAAPSGTGWSGSTLFAKVFIYVNIKRRVYKCKKGFISWYNYQAEDRFSRGIAHISFCLYNATRFIGFRRFRWSQSLLCQQFLWQVLQQAHMLPLQEFHCPWPLDG